MTRYILALLGLVIAVWLYRTVAIGWKLGKSRLEEIDAAWGGMPVRYRQTQPKDRWHLRIARKPERRKSA